MLVVYNTKTFENMVSSVMNLLHILMHPPELVSPVCGRFFSRGRLSGFIVLSDEIGSLSLSRSGNRPPPPPGPEPESELEMELES